MASFLFTFIAGNKIGRWLVYGVSTMGLLFLAFQAILFKGRLQERAKLKARRQVIIQEKVKVDEKIRKMSPSDRRKQLDRWVRDA
jgi:dipeptide/tripeptide permease